MLCVDKLLNGEIDKKLDDQIFWYAQKVKIKNNTIQLYTQNDCLIRFDDVDAQEIIQTISSLSKIEHTNPSEFGPVLISSGSFLFINNKLLVTQRTANTKYDPLHWTAPAGRCDRLIEETALKETIEEINIIKDGEVIYPDITQKLFQNKKVTFYPTLKKFPIDIKMNNVELYLDDILIEETQLWCYYSQKVNTLEFRLPIFANLDEKELEYSNPEYNMESKLLTINQLKEYQCVPSVQKLLEVI